MFLQEFSKGVSASIFGLRDCFRAVFLLLPAGYAMNVRLSRLFEARKANPLGLFEAKIHLPVSSVVHFLR